MSTPTSTSTLAVPATTVLFTRGVIARLSTWDIIRTAIQESWGGPNTLEKTRWLYGTIVDTFEQESETPDDQYIEEMLVQIMMDEFDVVVEDGSAEIVAKDVVSMWEEVQAGRGENLVQKWEEKADKLRGRKEVVQIQKADDEEEWEDDEDGEEDDDDEMDEDEEQAPQLIEHQPRKKEEPVIDEDGFTLVKGKGRR